MSWKNILNKVLEERLKNLGREPKDFADLLYLQSNQISPENHKKSFLHLLEKNPKDILEVGCGNGSVLYLFYVKGSNVYGTDFVDKSIEICKNIMPEGSFICSDAKNIPFNKKFDLILSNSVFQYFDNQKYVEDTIENLINKLSKDGLLIIGDIASTENKEKLIELRRKKLNLTLDEWNDRYKDLNQLYFDENLICQFLDKLGCKYKLIKPSQYISEHQKYKFDIWINI